VKAYVNYSNIIRILEIFILRGSVISYNNMYTRTKGNWSI